MFLTFKYFFTYMHLFAVYVVDSVHSVTAVKGPCQSSPYTTWGLGIKLKSRGLTANTFTCQTTSPASTAVFLQTRV